MHGEAQGRDLFTGEGADHCHMLLRDHVINRLKTVPLPSAHRRGQRVDSEHGK